MDFQGSSVLLYFSAQLSLFSLTAGQRRTYTFVWCSSKEGGKKSLKWWRVYFYCFTHHFPIIVQFSWPTITFVWAIHSFFSPIHFQGVLSVLPLVQKIWTFGWTETKGVCVWWAGGLLGVSDEPLAVVDRKRTDIMCILLQLVIMPRISFDRSYLTVCFTLACDIFNLHMCLKSHPSIQQLSHPKSQASAKRKSGLFPAGCDRNSHVGRSPDGALSRSLNHSELQLYSDSSESPTKPLKKPMTVTHDPRWEQGQRSTNTWRTLPSSSAPFGQQCRRTNEKLHLLLQSLGWSHASLPPH